MKKGYLRTRSSLMPLPVNYQHTNNWSVKVWNDDMAPAEEFIWGDGNHIYYRDSHVLSGTTWMAKEWHNFPSPFHARHVWTDGTNIYYSYYSSSTGEQNYVLNGDTWEPKVWPGISRFYGIDVWSDGTNIYCTDAILNHTYALRGDTWEVVEWGGDSEPQGRYVWSDGTNIYCGFSRILIDNTWEVKEWKTLPPTQDVGYLWTDGTNIYYSAGDNGQCVLNGDSWEPIVWTGLVDRFKGVWVWSDGTNIYFSNASNGQLVLDGAPVPVTPVNLNPALLVQSFFVGQAIRRMRGKPVAHTHAYTPAVTAPTCTEKGFTTYTCACGDSYTAEETEALGHAYVSEVVEPTTETEGYTLHTCSRCGDSYKDNYTEKLPEPQKTLIGYSYNGVGPLPDIEALPSEYPYRVLVFYTQASVYYAYCFASERIYKNNYLDIVGSYGSMGTSYGFADGAWIFKNEGSMGSLEMGSWAQPVWSNYSILNADGSTYLAASDPVPVYE